MPKKIVKFLLITLLAIGLTIQPAFADELPKPTADGDTLIEAIEKKDETKVEEILSKKVDPNSRGHKNQFMSPLKYAASSSNKPIVDSLIKYGADVKEKSLICFSFNNVEIVELLITHGADIQGANCGGNSPIHAAINSDALNTAELLLKHGADVNDQNYVGKRTPLQRAANAGKTKAVKWLLDHGADVNRPDFQGQTAISIGANAEILNMLLDHGATLPPPKEIPKITQGACWSGNLEVLKFLISRKINPDFDACYAALASMPSPNQDLLKWLTGRAKIKNIKVGNESMLHVAVEKNSLDIAKLLIASGADVNIRGDFDRPPLDGAILRINYPTQKTYHKEMIALLASHGADLNIKYRGAKGTMLHVLADAPNIQSSPSKYWEAYCQKQAEAAELLISYGADVNARDENGNTPLNTAAITNNILMIKTLISHGADPKAANNVGQTPLYNSIAIGHWGEIKRELLTIGTLASIEAKAGVKTNWASLKDVASKAYNPKEKQQIITLLDQLEQNPPGISQGNNLEKIITKIIDDAPKSLIERLGSCDPRIAVVAAEELINQPDTLKEPLILFSASSALFLHGKKDDAVFWFYAAQLRIRYQLAFENGDRGQLLTIMLMTAGQPINNYAFQDVSNLDRILDRVLEWDKKAPNPLRDKARSESVNKQIEQVYSGLRDLKAKIAIERDDLERKARLAAPEVERMYAEAGNRCRQTVQPGAPVVAPTTARP